MKIKITVDSIDPTEKWRHRSLLWEGEFELEDGIFMTKLSILGIGEPQPICEIPFSLNEGYYMWIPPYTEPVDENATELSSSSRSA